MESSFLFDAFLSYSSENRAEVLVIAEQLKAAGLEIWLDQWIIRPGDPIQAKIDEGLERSRALVFCMSKDSMGADWTLLESYTFRFRDPLNKERRFIPVRLDSSEIRASLAPFSYIDWVAPNRGVGLDKLIAACRPGPAEGSVAASKADVLIDGENSARALVAVEHGLVERPGTGIDSGEWIHWDMIKGHAKTVFAMALTPDGKQLITGSADKCIRVWDLESRKCLRVLQQMSGIRELVVNTKGLLYAACENGEIVIQEWATGRHAGVLRAHSDAVYSLVLTPDEKKLVSGSADCRMLIWDLEHRVVENEFHFGKAWVNAVVCAPKGNKVFAGTEDGYIHICDLHLGYPIHLARKHSRWIWSLALTKDAGTLISGSGDNTLRIWDTKTGVAKAVLEGHTDKVSKICLTNEDRWVVSGSHDKTVRIWDLSTGQTVEIFPEGSPVECVTASADGSTIILGTATGNIGVWKLYGGNKQKSPVKINSRYTNAKVLLVGESGAGKTGLSKRITQRQWEPTDSTVGGWATQLELPVLPGKDIDRQIWLWDFGGQADQRLIHQLYMDQTSLVVLVFDGQKEDVLETLAQWDRDLGRAGGQPFTRILVAARVDAGGLRISRSQVEAFAKEHGYAKFLETSAKENIRCDELRQAIIDGIQWDKIPWHSTPLLFRRLREEIVRLKDSGRVLMRFKELRETLKLGLTGPSALFKDEELKAVIGLLAGPGVVWELQFGSWILLQPEYVNVYAQAVIRTMRSDEQERGCIDEERVLRGDLSYNATMPRLDSDEEKFVLLAMHRTLVERGLCLREQTEAGPVLIFPSYYRRERPDIASHPAVLVSYRFTGFLDEIYATLIVRLHYTKPFRQEMLWRYAADFRTLTDKKLGVKMIRKGEGQGELEVYFEPSIPVEEKIIFSKYIHEHLLQHDKNVVRLRHYICPYCETLVGNREVAMKRLQEGKKDILCVNCEDPRRIPLWDKMEQLFASPEMFQQVRILEKQTDIILDNESKERLLVGEVISTVALAGQICREKNVSDHGIDMEIEFKSDNGEATGKMVYLQLKSGDSYLQKRKSDNADIFRIDKPRHVEYWKSQAFPVILVIRKSSGEVLWMDVRSHLEAEARKKSTPIRQIVFEGKRFDVMSVRHWREKGLG